MHRKKEQSQPEAVTQDLFSELLKRPVGKRVEVQQETAPAWEQMDWRIAKQLEKDQQMYGQWGERSQPKKWISSTPGPCPTCGNPFCQYWGKE
jgi:hypothetical protein